MSVFETVAIFQGHPLFWKEHWSRLVRAARERGIGFPHAQPRRLPETGDGVLRLYATAGPGGALDASGGCVYALYEAMECGCGFSALRVTSSAAVFLPSPGGWKTGNYWQHVDALRAASQQGCGEALLFNPAGHLVCAAMANVFLFLGGKWHTPALECGARDGVVRAWVLENFEVEESLPDSADAARCEACFLTNSRTGIRDVAELDGRPLAILSGPVQNLYREGLPGH